MDCFLYARLCGVLSGLISPFFFEDEEVATGAVTGDHDTKV